MSSVLSVLTDGLFDYAGAFPPASLSVPEAEAAYDGFASRPFATWVDRLCVPAAKLAELQNPRNVSVIGTRPATMADWEECLAADATAMHGVFVRHPDAIVAYETSFPPDAIYPKCLQDLRSFNEVDVFAEIHRDGDLADAMAVLAEQDNVYAKFRTGGVHEGDVPPVKKLAQFLYLCVSLDVPFKLTAGLHHPLRSMGEHEVEHGFINVLATTAFGLRHDLTAREMVPLLEAGEAHRWEWRRNRLTFEDLSIDVADAEEARALFCSIGSCSIEEPFQGMVDLGWWQP